MEEDYQKALEVIFTYGYGCCAFKHNICGDQPEVPDGMPDSAFPFPAEFFVNLRFPLVPTVIEATTTGVDLIESTKELKGNASVGD